MATANKRGSSWQYTISRMVDGKYKPIRKSGFRTKKEALAAAAEIETGLRKGVTPKLKLEPFDQYFESWIAAYKSGVSKNTKARYKDSLTIVKTEFGGIPIQKISKRDYQLFLNKFGETHAISSAKKLNSHIRACVKDAIDDGIIQTDFTRKAVLTGTKEKRPEEKHLHFEESKLLLNFLYEDREKTLNRYLILLALTSGMRFGELVGLTREDFNFFNNTISVNKQWGYTKQMPEGFCSTKNEQSMRTIKMDEDVMNEFKQLFKIHPDNIQRLVFYSGKSKYKVLSNAGTNKELEKILTELDIESLTIHGMRHTHASILLYDEISLLYVAERLGHKDTDTTTKTYAHIVRELRVKDEAKTISRFKSMRHTS
ncbi:tyrosine-type recombinase/integrase [Alkalicoccobacillus gibsonii]|uniref:tyrosine-type recombinase/integrase n=1 Tax=Alkalicoccobacillus gibsonii TaxID=79881 RepID=UPI003F7BD773